MGVSCEVTVTGATSLSLSQDDTKMLCVVLMHTVFFNGVTSSMFADDYDPNDVPADQARGYSYPVPETPLSLPLPVVEEYDDYDDYDPTDIPADQAAPAPSGYLPATPQYSQRRGRTFPSRKPMRSLRKMKGHMMKKARKAKSGMRKPKASGFSGRRFSFRQQSEATSAALRQGRQIMSVSEWLRRG